MDERRPIRQFEETPDDGSDIGIAVRWSKELEKPCCDPRNPKMNLGQQWLRESKKALAIMNEKPADQQNPFAIMLLEKAISQFEEKNNK